MILKSPPIWEAVPGAENEIWAGMGASDRSSNEIGEGNADVVAAGASAAGVLYGYFVVMDGLE